VRSIVWVHFDFGRHPALVLTSLTRRVASRNVTVVPGETAFRDGYVARVVLGPECGLAHETEFDVDSVLTVEAASVGGQIGLLPRSREPEVVAALARAFDLELPVTDEDW